MKNRYLALILFVSFSCSKRDDPEPTVESKTRSFYVGGAIVEATPQWQETYVAKLCDHANLLDAEFVTWFVYRDYDMLYHSTQNPPDILKIWRDIGLLDWQGNQRPSYQI